jgi:hypothetical protein
MLCLCMYVCMHVYVLFRRTSTWSRHDISKKLFDMLCLCMYVCVHACIHICVALFRRTSTWSRHDISKKSFDMVCLNDMVCLHVCMYVCMHVYLYVLFCSDAHQHGVGTTFIGSPDSGESDFLDSKRPELPKMVQNGRLECREPDSPESGKPMNISKKSFVFNNFKF